MHRHPLNGLEDGWDRHHHVWLDLVGWLLQRSSHDLCNLLKWLVPIKGLKCLCYMLHCDLSAVLLVLVPECFLQRVNVLFSVGEVLVSHPFNEVALIAFLIFSEDGKI